MNRITKTERDGLVEEAKSLLLAGGYSAKDEFDSNREPDYTIVHIQPIVNKLMTEYGLSKQRAKSIVAKALRQLRYKAFRGWRKND